MQCTRPLFAPAGFFRRSLDEFKRLSNIAIKMEGMNVPTKPYHIVNFDNPNSIDECKVMSDADMGGFSKATLSWQGQSGSEPAHARFHGNISTDLPPGRAEIQRSGYAAWRTRDRPPTMFGRSLWDIDPYSFLALKIKSDGRKYFINIQTESIVPTDIHQHRLYAQKDGEWETVVVSFDEFVRTNYGMVVEPQKEMMRQRVKSIGIGLIDRINGPFDLRIAEMYATNDSGGRAITHNDDDRVNMLGDFGNEKPANKDKGEPEKILI